MLAGLILVACGCCNFDYVPNHDIVVLKLAPDGALEWTRIIDLGSDDAGKDLVELPDGGYAIAGQTSERRIGQPHSVLSPPRPLLVRLSPDGAVAWDRVVMDGFDVAQAVVPAADAGTAVLTANGTVVRFDPDGRTLWTRATGIPEATALVPTADGGYLAGGRIMFEVPVNDTARSGTVARLPVITTEMGDGPVLAAAASRPTTPQLAPVPRRFDLVRKAMVVRLAPDGGIAWVHQYDDGGLNWLQSLAEGPARTGILVAGYGDTLNGSTRGVRPLLVLHLSPDGAPGPVTRIDSAGIGDPIWIRSDAAEYRMLYRNMTGSLTEEGFYDTNVVDAVLDRDGQMIERHRLDASIAVTWTADGGYFSVGTLPTGNRTGYDTGPYAAGMFHARRFDGAGALAWDRAFPGVPCDQVLKVVQTADGGYAVLGQRQNR